jgi:peroxiredoxin Q/BCP
MLIHEIKLQRIMVIFHCSCCLFFCVPLMIVSLTYTDGSMHSVDFSDLLEKSPYTILYFYPKDNTSGCTIQAQEFTQLISVFATHEVQVIGVSKDSHTSHCGFIEKH